MLANRLLPSSIHQARSSRLRHVGKLAQARQFSVQPVLDVAGQQFLDLSAALPFPPSFPPYASTIIAVSLFIRVAYFPVYDWASRRQQRLDENVRPKLPGIYKELADVVGKQMRKENYITTVNGDRQRFIAEHQRRHRKVFSQATTDLCRENKCRQWPTALIPPLVQLPPFLLVSYMLRDLCVSDSSFATEAFLMLSKLAAPDETFALPIAVGLLTMANVEINAWFSKNVRGGSGSRTATAQEVEVATKAPEGQSAVQQSSKINLSDTLRGVMRALAVGRIIFTALAPGAIALYWTASAAGGLVQTWIMNQLDIRRRAKSQSSKVQSDVLKTTAAPAKQALKPVSVKTKQRR